ncbi:hypothetical protein QBC37DRAFT_185284 [Rhypophila decipiens]|uniref:Uncharacterized protein n=1 Tax=Rhypophila decipiens TaxID=261697 RepID=A0AAN7B9A7_9PEZI|nr:hypothetical protein QBC37DRAFT_185284 [Rhypophila decipiens]
MGFWLHRHCCFLVCFPLFVFLVYNGLPFLPGVAARDRRRRFLSWCLFMMSTGHTHSHKRVATYSENWDGSLPVDIWSGSGNLPRGICLFPFFSLFSLFSHSAYPEIPRFPSFFVS